MKDFPEGMFTKATVEASLEKALDKIQGEILGEFLQKKNLADFMNSP